MSRLVNCRTIWVIQIRTLRALVLGPGPYLALSISIFLALLYVKNTNDALMRGLASVMLDPFIVPLLGMGFVGGGYVALSSGIIVSRERELGLLETLLFTPTTYQEYVIAVFCTHLTMDIFLVMAFLGACSIIGVAMNLILTPVLIAIAILSILTAASFVGLGLLTAAATRSVRSTILLLIGLVMVIGFSHGGEYILTLVVANGRSNGLIGLRDFLSSINLLTDFVSPVAYLLKGADNVIHGYWPGWIRNSLMAIVYGVITVGMSGILLWHRDATR